MFSRGRHNQPFESFSLSPRLAQLFISDPPGRPSSSSPFEPLDTGKPTFARFPFPSLLSNSSLCSDLKFQRRHFPSLV